MLDQLPIGSGVVVTITSLEGKKLVDDVLIQNGLSKETLEALMLDVAKSQKIAMDFTIPQNRE